MVGNSSNRVYMILSGGAIPLVTFAVVHAPLFTPMMWDAGQTLPSFVSGFGGTSLITFFAWPASLWNVGCYARSFSS